MKRTLVCIAFSAVCLALVGCGHSVIRTDRGTGLVAAIPLPSGSSLIELKLGNIDSTTAVLRGGAVYNADNAKGGTFGSVSTGDHIQVATQPAINEGYAQKVLSDPKVATEVKVAMMQYFASQKVSSTQPAAASAVNAAAGTGANPPDVKAVKTGVDNVVDKAADVAPKVVTPIAETTKSVVNDTKETIVNTTNDVRKIAIYAVIGIVILGVIAFIIFLFVLKKKKEKESGGSDKSTDSFRNSESKQNVAVNTDTVEAKETEKSTVQGSTPDQASNAETTVNNTEEVKAVETTGNKIV